MILGPAGPRPQGRAPRSLRGDPQGRLPAGAGRRRRWSTSTTRRSWRRQKSHHIEAVIDRVVVREGVRARLAESINLAVRHGDGLVLASHEEKRPAGTRLARRLFSTQYACPNCKISYEELEPRTFSFNSPYGACPECEGLGVARGLRPGAGPARRRALAGRRGDRPVESDSPAGDAKAPSRSCAAFWPRPASAGTRRWRNSKPQGLRAIPARRRQGFPRRAGDAGKGIRHHHQRAEAAAAGGLSRRGALPGVQRRAAAARGPRRSASRAGRSTR